ncbi:MAG: DedA family protein [Bacteroidaceae bacterium]|nr:DedA family protein [Bacteroidaceae bacterium]
MESLPFIQWCIDNLNEWTIILLMTIESSFIPFPSEIVVPPAAYFGEVSLVMVIVCATMGADLGAVINYLLAQWIGRPVVYKFADSRVGHMCLLNSQKIARAEQFFNKHGVVSTLIGRLVPGVRQLISIPAGLSRMHFGKFILYTTIGAGVWNTILALLGYFLRSLVTPEQLNATVDEFSHIVKLVIWGLLVLVILFFIVRFFTHKSQASTES